MIEVTFYEKTSGPCPHCGTMKRVLYQWIDRHPDQEVKVIMLPIESIQDSLLKVGITSAPFVEVRHPNICIKTSTAGLDVHGLVDLLEGR